MLKSTHGTQPQNPASGGPQNPRPETQPFQELRDPRPSPRGSSETRDPRPMPGGDSSTSAPSAPSSQRNPHWHNPHSHDLHSHDPHSHDPHAHSPYCDDTCGGTLAARTGLYHTTPVLRRRFYRTSRGERPWAVSAHLRHVSDTGVRSGTD